MKSVLVFTNSGCVPCKSLKKLLSDRCSGVIESIHYIDTEESPEDTFRFRITSVPTVLLMDGDNVQESMQGVSPSITTKINEFLGG